MKITVQLDLLMIPVSFLEGLGHQSCLKTHMAVSHIAVDLRLRNQCRYRVHDDDIHCAGTDHGLCNLEGLLAVVRLRDVEVVNIHTDILRIDRDPVHAPRR